MASKKERQERQVKCDTIQSYITDYRFKQPEVKGLLSFFLSKSKYLDKIEIVDDLSDKENSILISAVCTDGEPFVYKTGESVLTRTSYATVELLKKFPEKLYIKFETEEWKMTEERQQFVDLMTKWKKEFFSEQLRLIAQRANLMKEIDQALSDGNEKLFNSLSTKVKQLSQRLN